MLTEYIQAAMKQAKYEILEDDKSYYGEIPECQGVWANAETLEACRDELQEVLEEWILLGLQLGHTLPVIYGIDLNVYQGRVAVKDIPGITSELAQKLEAVGISNSDELLRRASRSSSRRQLAEQLGVEPGRLLELVNRADLIRIKGVGTRYTELLESVGIDSVRSLARRNPARIHKEINKSSEEAREIEEVPSLEQIEAWVESAKVLSHAS